MGFALSLVFFAATTSWFAYWVCARLARDPITLYPEFVCAWHNHYMEHDGPPVRAFEQWQGEWLETRIKAREWIELHAREHGSRLG